MVVQAKTFVLTAALLAAIGTAYASPTLTLDLHGAGLGIAPFTADSLLLGDYAKITTGNGGTIFSDTGFLPVEGFSLAGNPVSPKGFNDTNGSGWGAYFQYTGKGTQTLSASGLPETATYSQLSYELIGYNGSATFGFDAEGNPVISDIPSKSVVLAQGSLIGGMLAFVPTSSTSINIEGTASATFTPAIPQLSTSAPAAITLSVDHPSPDWQFTSPNTIEIDASSGASATLLPLLSGTGSDAQSDLPDPADPPAAVPEPASLLVFGSALIGLSASRRRMRRGGSNAAQSGKP